MNWVEQQGGLPKGIHEIADDLKEQGHDESSAIAIAVAAAKRFCAQGHSKWCDAVAEWERMKAATHTHTQLARQRRDLRHYEEHMSLDQIEGAIDGARAKFEEACGPAARKAAVTLADQVAAGGKPKLEPPRELVDAIHTELQSLYTLGRMSVSDELDRQRGSSAPATYARRLFPKSLAKRALLAARALMAHIHQAAAHQDLTERKQHADIQAAAEQAALGALRGQAMVHAAPALNEGRSAEAEDHADEIDGVYYTSILDGNRCEQCAKADDDVMRPLTDPIRLARKPPNPDCYGGSRCRCMEAFVLKSEAPANLSRTQKPKPDPAPQAHLAHTLDFNPDEPRDDHGRWAAGIKVGHRIAFTQGTDPATGAAATAGRGTVARANGHALMVNAGTPRKPRWVQVHREHARPIERKRSEPVGPGRREFMGRLNSAENAAVDSYKGYGYQSINGRLRAGGSPDTPSIRALDSAIRKGSVEKDLTVYRVMRLPDANHGTLIGRTFSDHAFVSTSEKRHVAERFVRKNKAAGARQMVLLRVHLHRGQPAAFLPGQDEEEILLPRDATFAVTADSTSSGMRTLDVEIHP